MSIDFSSSFFLLFFSGFCFVVVCVFGWLYFFRACFSPYLLPLFVTDYLFVLSVVFKQFFAALQVQPIGEYFFTLILS